MSEPGSMRDTLVARIALTAVGTLIVLLLVGRGKFIFGAVLALLVVTELSASLRRHRRAVQMKAYERAARREARKRS